MSDLAMVLPSFLGSAWRALVGRAVSQSMGVGNDENKRRRDEKLGPVIARDVASFFHFFSLSRSFFFFTSSLSLPCVGFLSPATELLLVPQSGIT